MTIPVWFVVLPGVMALDLTGPAETLALAGDAFSLNYIGPEERVVMSTGLQVAGIAPLPETLPPGSLLVLPGSRIPAAGFLRRRRWPPATG